MDHEPGEALNVKTGLLARVEEDNRPQDELPTPGQRFHIIPTTGIEHHRAEVEVKALIIRVCFVIRLILILHSFITLHTLALDNQQRPQLTITT
jgi:hypothetical protein